jgi:hypothetical protein
MKRRVLVLLLVAFCCLNAKAQLPPGSIAPDFTVTDINGQQHNLYTLLNEGKTVYLDFFATWCGPCWNFHNGHALKTIWDTYGPNGTNEAYVIAIEGDPSTNVQCISGPAGCNNTTQGNWTSGIPYPIADDAGVRGLYSVAYYPTIYMVCPGDKKVYETGQVNAVGQWNRRNQYCALNAALSVTSIQNVRCFGASTGKITLAPSGAIGPYTYQWSNGTTTTTPILNNIPAGTYACTVTPTQGSTGTLTGIMVEGPPSIMSVGLIESLAPGCNGMPGNMTIEASGGWPGGYNYSWNNGQNGPELLNVQAGNYTVTVTDDGLCTKTQVFSLAPAPPLVASIAAPGSITCAQSTVTISAANSSSGANISYNWFASNGGVIVSGANTLTPVVGAAGNYTLQITNSQTTCNAFATTSVATNIVPPTANAGPTASINCTQTTAQLQGVAPSGSNFSVAWTASGGGNIVSGANTLTPTVNASGTYTIVVTNTQNGCTATSATTVSGNGAALAIAATGGMLTCTANSVTLAANGANAGATYAWTGPNGFTSAAQNPAVNEQGNYTVLVTDATGCSGTATTSVGTNTNAPTASAAGGAITCANNNVTLQGGSNSANATFAWTGPNNFTATGATPTASAAGDYTVVATDPANGCTASATANIAANNTAPAASIATAANLNCNTAQVQLNATNSTQGAGITYEWSSTNGNIVSGGNTLTPLVSAAGTYNLLISNTNTGCTNTASSIVVQNNPVAATTATTAVTCNGATNGAAAVSANGGNGTYTYLWGNGATTSSVNGLSAGQYAVVVTDGEGCTTAATIDIAQPNVLAANATASAQSANGVNDGTASASPTGGTAGYTYLWNNNETTASISGLTPGNYTVAVTDANGCTAIQIVTVNAFNCALASSINATNVSCAGSNNGSASVVLQGANAPVSYNWSNGATTETVSNLAAGNYTVAIMDASNCPAQLSVTIAEPAPLSPNTTSTPESASGANDGTATASPVGGTGNYTYVWSNGATTATITNLAPGTYTVTVGDENGCQAVRSVTVNSFDCTLSPVFTVSNVNCFGQNNGTATVGINGGTAPFAYAWSNGNNTATAVNLAAGTYEVQITDDNGCQTTGTVTVTQPANALAANITSVTNTICPNETTGAVSVEVAGGTQGYTYNWSNGATTANLANVPAGSYTLVVTDANGCTNQTTATVSSNDNVPPTISTNAVTLAIGQTGTAVLNSAALAASVSDNCGSVTISIPNKTYTCADLGEYQVSITAVDQSNNSTTAIITVNVVDVMVPVLVCPASISICPTNSPFNYPAPTATDNCLAGGTWELLEGLPSNSVFPTGTTTTQTYRFTDASGNAGLCSFNVTVSEAIAVVETVTNNTSLVQPNGSIALAGSNNYTYAWSTGATMATITGLAGGTYTVSVTDPNGCVLTSVYVVENVVNVQEPTWMAGMRVQPNPTSGMAQVILAQIPDEELRIRVHDLAGRLMLEQASNGQTAIELDCSNFPEGMYIIQLQSGRATGARKLSVQR